MVSSSLPALSFWRGEFADADMEQAFRASVQRTMARQLQIALVIWAVLILLFALTDLQALGAGDPRFQWLTTYRAAMAVALVYAAHAVVRRPQHATSCALVVGIAIAGYPFYFLMLHLRPDVRVWTVSMVMFMQFSLFIFLPGRVFAYLPVALFGLVGCTLTYVVQGRPVAIVLGLVFLLAMPALVGYVTAARLQIVQRQEFALRRRLSEANTALQTEIARRVALEAELQHQATTDPLTGLVNRREFERRFTAELARAQREGAPLSVVLIDLDHFKRINDTYGHAMGDEVLRTLARLSADSFRAMDTVGRLGGEEFAVLLPGADLQSAAHAAQRLARRLAAAPVEHGGQHTTAAMTAGVAQRLPEEATLAALLERADAALYAGKQAGSGRVMLAQQDAVSGAQVFATF